jgi:hypothetical protein
MFPKRLMLFLINYQLAYHAVRSWGWLERDRCGDGYQSDLRKLLNGRGIRSLRAACKQSLQRPTDTG